MRFKQIANIAILLLSFCPVKAQKNLFVKYSLSGFVREKGSRETLSNANVYIEELKTGTSTNNYGFFSLTVAKLDSITLKISYSGYETLIKRISTKDLQNSSLIFELSEKTVLLDETIVKQEENEQHENSQMSTLKLSIKQAKLVPALLGERDLLKVFQLMPGIQKATEGTAGLYVRGGSADQNLILLDEATVYNASHLFGIFSIFNGDAIKSMELLKAGFPARYGGRVSSVVDVQMKDGNKQAFHGEATLGLISAKVMLEGPIKKDKSSFLFSGRRTYFDLFTSPAFGGGTATYYFYDLNLKLNYEFSVKDKVYLSSYLGKDNGSLTESSTISTSKGALIWQNITSTFRWNHLFSQRLFLNSSFIFSDYHYTVSDEQTNTQGVPYQLKYSSGISDFGLKLDLDYVLSPNNMLKMGVTATNHRFNPNTVSEQSTDINQTTQADIKFQEMGVYLEENCKIGKVSLNLGLRGSIFGVNGKTYTYLEPRISSVFPLKNNMSIKVSYTQMNQFVHLLSNSGTGLPTDLWVPSTEKIAPQQSQQIALGLYKDLEKLSVSIEGYYKYTNHIIAYKEGTNSLLLNGPAGLIDERKNTTWEDNVTTGQGWAYGTELFLQKKTGKLTGWVGYTLSWTQHQFDELNKGERFWAKYDRRHDVSIVGLYQLSKNITLTGTWVYSSGNLFTLPLSRIQLITPELNPATSTTFYNTVTYGERNNFRAEAYHRMDVGCQFNKQKKWGERTWEISVYNLYAHLNPFIYKTVTTIDSQGNLTNNLKKVALFPIIPSVSYKIKF